MVRDADGNVYVVSIQGNCCLIKYDPSGQQLGIWNLPDPTGYLALDRSTGNLLDLHSGTLDVIDPKTMSFSSLHLRDIAFDTSSVFDVETGQTTNYFSGSIASSNASFGDLAVWNHGTTKDIFISGMSYPGVFPFVMRLLYVPDSSGALSLESAKVLVASRGVSRFMSHLERGVAVAPDGTVLTMLPYDPTRQLINTPDYAYSFSAEFDIAGSSNPRTPHRELDGMSLGGNGMDSDAAGNFYVAASGFDVSLCPSTEADVLVVIAADLSRHACYTPPPGGSLSSALALPRDVSVRVCETNLTCERSS